MLHSLRTRTMSQDGENVQVVTDCGLSVPDNHVNNWQDKKHAAYVEVSTSLDRVTCGECREKRN